MLCHVFFYNKAILVRARTGREALKPDQETFGRAPTSTTASGAKRPLALAMNSESSPGRVRPVDVRFREVRKTIARIELFRI
jgi:hypothetical protein